MPSDPQVLLSSLVGPKCDFFSMYDTITEDGKYRPTVLLCTVTNVGMFNLAELVLNSLI